MKKQQIAAQLYTLREFTQNVRDIEETLRRVSQIGYTAVQVSGFGPIEPALLKSYTDKYNLTICATHTAYDRIKNQTEQVISEHKLWGCRYVGLGGMPQEYRTGYQGYMDFVSEFDALGRIYAQNGLKLIYHNHDFEFEKFDGKLGLEIILEGAKAGSYEMEIDTYWVQSGGGDPVDWIYRSKGQMGVVHFKDMAIKDRKQVFAEIGEGNLDWAAIIKACDDIGVVWAAVEQDKCMRDPFDSLELSFKNIESMLGGG